MNSSRISVWLSRTNSFAFTIYAIIAAFSTYSCMYAFRKPFTVATFEGISYWGMDYKTILIIAQVLGYMLSKFLGIKIVSEMNSGKRAFSILILIALAEIALFLFSIIPAPINIVFLFLNGLPLGMVWGLVFSFLEGRKLTEVLGAGLSISFIVSSGLVKSIGKIVIDRFGFTEMQMPYITGAFFALPLVFFVWMLNQIPPPNEKDEEMRTKRIPMNKKDRINFFSRFASGIIILTVIYMALTAFRDMRDNFAAEIWNTLGFSDQPMIFTYTEIPIAIIVLAVMGSIMLIKNNMQALMINLFLILGGVLLIGVSTFAFQVKMLSPQLWMILTGLGLYLGYVPFNCILFDRFIAVYKTAANAGFLIYIADSFGYLASVGVLFFKNFGNSQISWYDFFIKSNYVLTLFGGLLTILSIIYFRKKQLFLNNIRNKNAEVETAQA